MARGDVKLLLKELGLNEYEIRAYLTLIEHGAMAASDLATISGVPQPRIYDVVNTLMAKGFVVVGEGRPKRVIPIEPAQVFKGLKERYNRLVDYVEKQLENMYRPKTENETVLVIRSMIPLEEYMRSSIDSAKFSVSVALPDWMVDKIAPNLLEKEDTRVHLFIYGKPKEVPDVDVVKTREIPDPLIIISDRRMGIYAPNEALAKGQSSLRGYALVIYDPNLLFILDRYFYQALWPTGKLVHRKQVTLKLPRTYISIRDLIDDIKTFNLKGAKVKVKGHMVRTGKPISIEGKIVDYYESEGRIISNITVEATDGKRYVIGGWNASLEDVEAETITVIGGEGDV